MSEQNDNPPPPENSESGGNEAVEQEEEAPPPTEPVEDGEDDADVASEESSEADEATETDDGETAPLLTEATEEDTAASTEVAQSEETQSEETQSEVAQAEDTQSEETQAEGGEQQPLPADLERHVFDGEIKTDRDGDYYISGYHHREGGEDQGDLTAGSATETDRHGVYEAEVTGTAPDGTELTKDYNSSFFPDDYSKEDVRDAIREAFANRTESSSTNPRQWEGVTSDGMTIQGYVGPGTTVADATEDDIKTAYPVWEGRFLV